MQVLRCGVGGHFGLTGMVCDVTQRVFGCGRIFLKQFDILDNGGGSFVIKGICAMKSGIDPGYWDP